MSADLKYQLLADELRGAIRNGRLAIGSRLQSVRKVMEQRGVSMATVLSAYRALEEQGLIAARPKSGYFVVGDGAERAGPANLQEGASGDASGAWAGGANYPDPELLPQRRLHRLTASVVRRNQYLTTRHPDGLGIAKLRREIARRSADVGSFIRAGELIITNGATEALALALRAVARPGDSVALQTPAHPLFLALLANLHVNVVEIPAHPTQGFSLEALDSAIAGEAALRACLLVPNFHHPTGALMSVAGKRALLTLAERADLAVIEVDVYGELQHQGPRPPPLKAFDSNGSVIYVTSFSKTIAPGLNVGWTAAGRWQSRIEATKQTAAVATAELPQLVLHEFLSRGSHLPHFRRLRHLLRERTLRIDAALRRGMPGACRWAVPEGGYFLWLELPTHVDASRLLTQPGIAGTGLSPGYRFSAQGHYGHCVRINTSTMDPGAVAVFAKAVSRALNTPA